ncbi:MAG: hypothetical protein IT438_11965 [Phycisphaerales bacterium]|nr:hypothetical protein [Phycisphaerales bacterium]
MTASSLYSIAFVLAGIRLAHQGWLQGPMLSEGRYRRGCVLIGALRRWKVWAPLGVAAGVIGWNFSGSSWGAIGGEFRVVAGVIAIALAWSFSTYARNLFLNRTHGVDRAALLVLGAMVWAHPLAIGPFMAAAVVMMRQFEHPACLLYSQTHTRLPVDLMLAMGLWPVAATLFAPEPATLPVLLLSIAGCSYWMPGLAKAKMGPFPGAWVLHNRVHRLAVSARQQGWLGRVPMPTFLRAARTLGRVDVAIAAVTLAVELLAIAILAGRSAAVTMLATFAGLHAVILLSSGINFWKWVVADLALAWLVWSMPTGTVAAVFTPEHLAVSVLIMATQSAHLRCVELGWLDTRLSSFFRLEVVGRSGRVYRLWPGALAPFDMVFAQHRHYHLCPMKTLTNTYGTLYARGKRGWTKYAAIEAARGREPAHEQARQEHGFAHTDEGRSREFERFLREVLPRMTERNRAGHRRDWWACVPAPKHIYVSEPAGAWAGQEQPVLVRAWFEERWHDASDVRQVSSTIVREFALEQPEIVVRPVEPVAGAAIAA